MARANRCRRAGCACVSPKAILKAGSRQQAARPFRWITGRRCAENSHNRYDRIRLRPNGGADRYGNLETIANGETGETARGCGFRRT
jgi:hypothetical protein